MTHEARFAEHVIRQNANNELITKQDLYEVVEELYRDKMINGSDLYQLRCIIRSMNVPKLY